MGVGVNLHPCPLPPAVVQRAGSEGRRAGELALPLTDCSTQESRLAPCLGNSGADLDSKGTGWPVLRDGELVLPLRGCNTWESESYTLIWQHSGSGSSGADKEEAEL